MNNCEDHMGTRLQKISAARCVFRVLAIFSLSLVARPSLLCAQDQTSIPEEIEWTWEVRSQLADPKLPNVLLLGDSITRNYFPQVTKDLRGVANVYLLASSTSVGDPPSSPSDCRVLRLTGCLVHCSSLQQRLARLGIFRSAIQIQLSHFSPS